MGHEVTAALETGLQKERGIVRNLVQESRIYLFMSLGIILLIALSTFAFLFYHVEQPLRRIGMAIQKIASGDYRNFPEVETGDEFENLAHSLNVMLDELNKRSEQLVQSEKMAALGTLTSGVAHEINNPLNNISTSLQILLEELDEGDLEYQRELLTETGGEVERAQDIVRALLEYSRKSAFGVSRERFRDLVDNALKLIQGEIPTNVHVETDIPEEIHATVDPRRIQQVLLNLLINGFQAMEPDGGTLRLSAFEDKEGRGFYFRVQDTGKGVPQDQLGRIFDPFYTTKGDTSGSGLGLSVSRGIIESHQGSITVDSQKGVGTTFTVYLPYEQSADGTGT
ncbi:MAG: HAMP domain-containing histidine kinase [Desulfohalobiaceae bacterium]|nr:HAMP domain-containing histidine kinase [Desulfohalobiaceae bacterium]